MSEHTKEPWSHFNSGRTNAIYDGDRREIVAWMGFDRSDRSKSEHRANARRIVACVNACTGIPTKELEKTGTIAVECRDEVQEELLKAWKQRDELKQQNERLFAKLRYYQNIVVLPRVGPVATIPCGVSGQTSVYMPSPIKLDELLTQRDELLAALKDECEVLRAEGKKPLISTITLIAKIEGKSDEH